MKPTPTPTRSGRKKDWVDDLVDSGLLGYLPKGKFATPSAPTKKKKKGGEMSNYFRFTKNPKTGKFEKAEWIDNYFGHYNYAVKFPDGSVYKADEREWEFEDD